MHEHLGLDTGRSAGPSMLFRRRRPSTYAHQHSGEGRQDYADGIQAAAGPRGTKTWAFSASRAWAGWLLALRPTP